VIVDDEYLVVHRRQSCEARIRIQMILFLFSWNCDARIPLPR
jgi:hypothetical protein